MSADAPGPWFEAPAPLLPEILALNGRWLGRNFLSSGEVIMVANTGKRVAGLGAFLFLVFWAYLVFGSLYVTLGFLAVGMGSKLGILAAGVPFDLGLTGPFITVAALAAAMNAFNMLDGTDGQSSGVALVTLLGLISAAALGGQAPPPAAATPASPSIRVTMAR